MKKLLFVLFAAALVACTPKQVSAPAVEVAAPAVTVQPATPAPAAVEPATVSPAATPASANVAVVAKRRHIRVAADECAAYIVAYTNAGRANHLLGAQRYTTTKSPEAKAACRTR